VSDDSSDKCPSEQELLGALLVSKAGGLSRGSMLSHIEICGACRCLIAEGVRPEGPGESTTRMEPAALQVGERLLGRFEVLSFVARGGMGEVYRAKDHDLDDVVALKTIAHTMMDDDEAFGRFKREVQLARKVTHPNVCRILEFGVHRRSSSQDARATVPFLVMEFLHGKSLRRSLYVQAPMALPLVSALAQQITSALAAIHRANVVHGDLKSDNIFLVARSGNEPRAVLVDFGLARPTSCDDGRSGSFRSVVAGTPAYMAPEQLLGATPTRLSDIYSLGVVFFEMLTGRLPFDTSSEGRSLSRLPAKKVLSPSDLRPEIPRTWDRLTVRCLAHARTDRFPDVEAVLAAIEEERAPRFGSSELSQIARSHQDLAISSSRSEICSPGTFACS